MSLAGKSNELCSLSAFLENKLDNQEKKSVWLSYLTHRHYAHRQLPLRSPVFCQMTLNLLAFRIPQLVRAFANGSDERSRASPGCYVCNFFLFLLLLNMIKPTEVSTKLHDIKWLRIKDRHETMH